MICYLCTCLLAGISRTKRVGFISDKENVTVRTVVNMKCITYLSTENVGTHRDYYRLNKCMYLKQFGIYQNLLELIGLLRKF
jgi:hypothetical protein